MSHIESNIPKNMLYFSVKGEILFKCSFSFVLRRLCTYGKKFITAHEKQGSKRSVKSSSLGKIVLAHTESFQQFSISCQDLLYIFSEDE